MHPPLSTPACFLCLCLHPYLVNAMRCRGTPENHMSDTRSAPGQDGERSANALPVVTNAASHLHWDKKTPNVMQGRGSSTPQTSHCNGSPDNLLFCTRHAHGKRGDNALTHYALQRSLLATCTETPRHSTTCQSKAPAHPRPCIATARLRTTCSVLVMCMGSMRKTMPLPYPLQRKPV